MMPAIRGVVLSLAAIAVLYTLGLRAADRVAQDDPAAQIQLATDHFEAARYREALDAYDAALRGTNAAIATRARKGKVRAALRIAEFDLARAEAETLNADAAADAE